MKWKGFDKDGRMMPVEEPSDDLTFVQLVDPRVEPALAVITAALIQWRGQSLVAQTAVLDVLLDVQNLLTGGSE